MEAIEARRTGGQENTSTNSSWATMATDWEEEAARPRFGKVETNTEIGRRRGGDCSILRNPGGEHEVTGRIFVRIRAPPRIIAMQEWELVCEEDERGV